MTNEQIHEMAQKLRMEAVRMVYEGKDGHPGPALSIADIIATLYFDVMNIDPKNPEWPDRDRLILSKGHSCPILYAALNERGYFEPKVEHFELRQLHSMFQGHPSMHSTPGLDMTSGSLGNGIAIGAGMAFAAKTLEISGHDIGAIRAAVEIAKSQKGVPCCIVCDCVKGKGVSYMENNNAWHKGVPTDEEYAIAVKELGGVQA